MSGSSDLGLLGGDVLEVAPRLLGSRLSHGDVTVRITEVEAYAGEQDPASHAFRGPTPRTATMFGPAGHLYVYLSHGIHHCCNVVCGPDGEAAAVLLRAGEVVSGEPSARAHRGDVAPARLARGPGNLCSALGIDLGSDGVNLTSGPVRLDVAPALPATSIQSGPRVGVSAASQRSWRFWIVSDPTVSAYRRGRMPSGPHPS